jgi:predicted transcriptional regulator
MEKEHRMADSQFVVRVSASIKERIDALAKSLGRSRNDILNEAITRYVEEESWLIAELQDAIIEADASGACFTHEEVMRSTQEIIDHARSTRLVSECTR